MTVKVARLSRELPDRMVEKKTLYEVLSVEHFESPSEFSIRLKIEVSLNSFNHKMTDLICPGWSVPGTGGSDDLGPSSGCHQGLESPDGKFAVRQRGGWLVPRSGCLKAEPELLHLSGGFRQDGHRHTGSSQTPDLSAGHPRARPTWRRSRSW